MPTLEERVSQLETQVKRILGCEAKPVRGASWENIIGTFADSDGFDEAVRRGREYRESLRPKDYKATR